MIKLYLTPGTRAGRVAWLLEELNIQYDPTGSITNLL